MYLAVNDGKSQRWCVPCNEAQSQNCWKSTFALIFDHRVHQNLSKLKWEMLHFFIERHYHIVINFLKLFSFVETVKADKGKSNSYYYRG